ncbi:MAG: [acyl-carrier-protein] S-malonyltransferase [Campylobacteraceae bacterium 4484_166]|nr:MAG: [acyl-carrier-protein] S-malonyltransferase [Campylobacteraceae bacterium 4484_166]
MTKKNISLIFPGQGSQKIGMCKDFFDNNNIAKEMIKEASDRISVDFKKLMFEENDLLKETKYTQPAILLTSCIAYELFKQRCDIEPDFVLGHSLGEFSAIVASKAIDYLDAVELVHKRGEFMSEACQNIDAGMMAILGLDDKTIEDMTKKQREENRQIWTANYNMDGQLVVAGKKEDLQQLSQTYIDAGAKRAIVLDMSVASHCPLLETAVDKLKPYLEKYIKKQFAYPIISNVTAKQYSSKDEAVELLSRQLVSPVLYKQSIIANKNNTDIFIEMGHGTVLKGINKKIDKTINTLNIYDEKSLTDTIFALEN